MAITIGVGITKVYNITLSKSVNYSKCSFIGWFGDSRDITQYYSPTNFTTWCFYIFNHTSSAISINDVNYYMCFISNTPGVSISRMELKS